MAMPAAGMQGNTPEQAAIMVLQNELAQTRQAVQAGAAAHDALQRAHEALNNAAQAALADKDRMIKEVEDRLRTLVFRQGFDLLDAKDLKPEHFRGRQTEAFRPWQKRFKAFCNSKRSGFRAALEWAEQQTTEIADPSHSGWEEATAAAPKLHDYLLQVLEEQALLLIDKPILEGRGFESWRLLVQQYSPSGGAYELDSMMALMTVNQCKTLHELPGAVSKFERDIDLYERKTGRAFPPEWKAPAFLRMIPKSHISEMRFRFTEHTQDYEALKRSILSYSQHLRMDNALGRGDNDMQVDFVDEGWATGAAMGMMNTTLGTPTA